MVGARGAPTRGDTGAAFGFSLGLSVFTLLQVSSRVVVYLYDKSVRKDCCAFVGISGHPLFRAANLEEVRMILGIPTI